MRKKIVLLPLVALAVLTSPAAFALSPDIVISQVYGGGGNASATLRNDYIELFNRGAAAVNLAGWSVQYTSATGTGLFSTNVTTLSGTCLLYTSPSPRDRTRSRMPSSA